MSLRALVALCFMALIVMVMVMVMVGGVCCCAGFAFDIFPDECGQYSRSYLKIVIGSVMAISQHICNL